MNAVCTIAAKNYLAHARTLGDSLQKNCPGIKFHILLADETEGLLDLTQEKFDVLEVKDIGIPFLKDMAFKYNVIEFCTSVKPFYLEYLFNKYGYEKITYLDPDMYVYHPLDDVWDALEDDFIVLTPHLLKPYVHYDGATSEEELLFVGIYNLGFVAFNNSPDARNIIEWWKVKLKDQCFADKDDALHVDQRWMDFLPALYEKGVKILRHPGYNLAVWNMHERVFSCVDGDYKVDEAYSLVVFHFSGFDPHNYETICRKQSKFNLANMPQYRQLFEAYVRELLNNEFDRLTELPYSYSKFKNGIEIINLYRRLYRALCAEDYDFADPFLTDEGSYYDMLKKNKLLILDRSFKYNKIKKVVKNYQKKMAMMFRLMNVMKSIIGIRRYYLLLRFIAVFHKFEKQTFLINR